VTRYLALVAIFGGLPACPLTIEPADEQSVVGQPCQTDLDCPVGACLTSQPGGYCTMGCLGGQPCPAGSRCVTMVFFGLKDASCWRTCNRHEDCGRAGYSCMVPPDNGGLVCANPSSP